MENVKFHKAPSLGLKITPKPSRGLEVSRLGISLNNSECKHENAFTFVSLVNIKKLIGSLSSNYFENDKFDSKHFIYDRDTSWEIRQEDITSRGFHNGDFVYKRVNNDDFILHADKSKLTLEEALGRQSQSESIEAKYYKTLSRRLRLNNTICYLDNKAERNVHYINFNTQGKFVGYNYYILYKDANQGISKSQNNFSVKDNYIAIKLEGVSAELLFFFVEQAYGITNANRLRESIYNSYLEKLKKATDIKALKFLYNNLPNYIKLGYSTEEEKDKKPYKLPDTLLWEHFLKFVDYDSGVNDASYYVLNTMTLITPKYCMTEFIKDQSLVMKIYNGLDDRSAIDTFFGFYPLSKTFDIGENTLEATNKDVFVTLLNFYIQYHENDSSITVFESTGAHFRQGTKKGSEYEAEIKFKLDSNIVTSDTGDTKETKNKIYLKNKWESKQYLGYSLNQQGNTVYEYEFKRGYHPSGYYNPLDVVKFTQYNDKGEGITINVPIILIKHAAYVEEWEHVNEGVRFGVNVFMIIAGVATLASGVGSLMLYATIADMGLATTDIIIQSEKDNIKKSQKGKEFLENWDKIYTIGGIATFSPVAVKAVATYGPKMVSSGADLLQTGKTIANPATYKKIKDLTTKAIHSIEIPNFNKTGLEILKLGFKSIPELRNAIKLQKLGVVFVKGGKDTMAVIYKGVAVVSGKVKEVGEKLNTAIKNLRGSTLEKYLDDLVEVALDNIKGKGRYGGKILSKADLDLWAKNLLKKYGTKIERVDSFDKPGILAQFDANTNTIRYKDDVTEYFMTHESFHAEEMSKIGKAEYIKDAPLRDVAEADYTDANWIRLYKREKYVYDKLVENAKKYKFNSEELANPPFGHAFRYFDYFVVLELEKRNIPIPKI